MAKEYLNISEDFPDYKFDPDTHLCPEHGVRLEWDIPDKVWDCPEGEWWEDWYIRGERGRHG